MDYAVRLWEHVHQLRSSRPGALDPLSCSCIPGGGVAEESGFCLLSPGLVLAGDVLRQESGGKLWQDRRGQQVVAVGVALSTLDEVDRSQRHLVATHRCMAVTA